MNSIVGLQTIAVFVLGFCLICESALTIGPNDTSVILGGNVKLECVTADKYYPPAWSYLKAGSGEKKDISLVLKQGDLIVPKLLDGYVERHSIVGDRSTGEYSLRITDAKPEDAGIYTCTARGGLGSAEKRSAELSVFEPFPTCAPNITDVVGENDCHREPDVIEFSCKFRVHGKYLRHVTWMDVNHPEKAIKIDNPMTDTTGIASSKLIITGSYVGLDTTSFRCMVASTENADVNRCSCHTPKINVLKITNLTESKTLVAPEEVECTGWTKLNASGCKWLRRDVDDGDNDHQRVGLILVTSKPLLNLHKQDMKPGTYICIAECNIRGETCEVKLLDVSYQPPWATVQPGSEQSIAVYAASVIVGVAIIATGLGLLIWKRYKNRRRPQTVTYQGMIARSNGLQNQYDSLLSQESRNGGPVVAPNGEATQTPVVGSANGFAGQQETSSLAESRNDVPIDIPDAKLGGLTKSERIRLIEERAEARMRANVARQSGENNQAFSPDTDVAEGVAADKKKHE